MTTPLRWPRKNPFDKVWFQIQIGRQLTSMRADRLDAMIDEWEPRLWASGVNLPAALLEEHRRVSGVMAEGGVDWAPFPEWVRRKRMHDRRTA